MNTSKKNFKLKMFSFSLVLTIVLSLVSTYTFAASPVYVTLTVDTQTTPVETSVKTVKDLLSEKSLSYNASDKVMPSPDTVLENNMDIILKKAKDVVITADGQSFTITTSDDIDKDFFKNRGIEVGALDYVCMSYNETTQKDEATLVRVEEKEVSENAVIESSTVSIDNPYLYVGKSVTVKQGENGEKKINYNVRYENGVETSRIILSEEVIKVPVDTIVEVGTKPIPQQTLIFDDGKELKYSKVITVNASAYDLSYESCGKRPGDYGYGVTASGMRASYGVVAVDPRVIPLGTKLYITSPDGSWTYGEAVAGDTGGSIKGNRVDLFFNSRSQCLSFGRRTAVVYVLS